MDEMAVKPVQSIVHVEIATSPMKVPKKEYKPIEI